MWRAVLWWSHPRRAALLAHSQQTQLHLALRAPCRHMFWWSVTLHKTQGACASFKPAAIAHI